MQRARGLPLLRAAAATARAAAAQQQNAAAQQCCAAVAAATAAAAETTVTAAASTSSAPAAAAGRPLIPASPWSAAALPRTAQLLPPTAPLAAAAFATTTPAAPFSSKSSERTRWEWMAAQGHKVNPCNSKLHPAAEAGMAPDGDEMAVQDAYTPHSTCWGCGPSAAEGLRLRSFRVRNGLEARVTLGEEYCAFPGIINGGIISTLIDCHGNWTAAIGLMDRSCLPAPPLTLTASVLVSFKEPAPPNTPLVIRSSIVEIKEGSQPGVGKV